jgi:hypothetical protein
MKTIRLFLLLILPAHLFAQQISPDPGFGDGGIINHRLSSGSEVINCSAPGGNGTVLVAGECKIFEPTLSAFDPAFMVRNNGLIFVWM